MFKKTSKRLSKVSSPSALTLVGLDDLDNQRFKLWKDNGGFETLLVKEYFFID